MSELARQIGRIATASPLNQLRAETAAMAEKRQNRQMREVAAITQGADAIETHYSRLGIPLPNTVHLFTAGFNSPEGAQIIGACGDEVFAGFPPPDIYGHAGTISALGDKTFMNGRAHPNEWTGYEDGPMIVARPLQTWKEIARRQRARGFDPLFVLTYLVGVREDSSLKPGDVGLIIDDTELSNTVHPGHGPRGILDTYTGSHFQPKAGRASNLELAKRYSQFALDNGYGNMYPAAACGTPGTTEYQSFLEVGLLDAALEKARAGNLGIVAKQVFGDAGPEKLSLLYDMGITAELATMRQTFEGEEDFKVLALGLATDAVGGEQSLVVDHNAVVGAAFAAGAAHRDMLLRFGDSYDPRLPRPMPDFSIQGKLK